MSHLGSYGTSAAPPRKYLFIDGRSFEKAFDSVASKILGHENGAIDWTAVTTGFKRTFLYDALPSKKPSQTDDEFECELKEKIQKHNRIRVTDRLQVREGATRFRKKRGAEQKGVDVMLAVECLQQCISSNMDEAHFITSDLDFYPLLEALGQTRVSSTLLYDTSLHITYGARAAW